jgi:hypothetical protein
VLEILASLALQCFYANAPKRCILLYTGRGMFYYHKSSLFIGFVSSVAGNNLCIVHGRVNDRPSGSLGLVADAAVTSMAGRDAMLGSCGAAPRSTTGLSYGGASPHARWSYVGG